MATSWQMGTRNGIEVVELVSAASTCTVALGGAQVLSFAPRGEPDWLWVSDKARWSVGTALRGGVPICFPWFGPHPTERAFPAHGFARTRLWRLRGVDEPAPGQLRAVFELASDAATSALFPHPFTARQRVTVGEDLELSFEVANDGPGPLSFEVALHSYFSVSDVGSVAVAGLERCAFVDKVAGGLRTQQGEAPLRIEGEVDRVYDSGGPVTLLDPVRPRQLQIQPAGARSTVVWNPGPEKTAALADMDRDGYRGFVCVETGSLGEHRITLPPGGRSALSVRYAATL
jgi:glucose-6-phosphate 1-epimerase